MNRIKDHTCFATCFAGVGYVVLWPICAGEFGGAQFGAAMFCHDGATAWLDYLCNSVQPLTLPPGLHALGFTAALFATARLLVSWYQRSRRPRPPAIAVQVAPETPPPPLRKLRPHMPEVKPRAHFGLRGMPR